MTDRLRQLATTRDGKSPHALLFLLPHQNPTARIAGEQRIQTMYLPRTALRRERPTTRLSPSGTSLLTFPSRPTQPPAPAASGDRRQCAGSLTQTRPGFHDPSLCRRRPIAAIMSRRDKKGRWRKDKSFLLGLFFSSFSLSSSSQLPFSADCLYIPLTATSFCPATRNPPQNTTHSYFGT